MCKPPGLGTCTDTVERTTAITDDLRRPWPDRHLRGVVASFDGAMATLLLGPDQEPWEFPREMVPEGAGVGCCVRVGMCGPRPVEVQIDHEAEMERPRPVEARLRRLARLERRLGVPVGDRG